MAKDRLVVDDRNGAGAGGESRWRLTWFIADEGELGGSVSSLMADEQKRLDEVGLKGLTLDEWERVVCYLTARDAPGAQEDTFGLYWSSVKEARAALRLVQAALKAGREVELPEWAKQALAAGWKAPKGWKP